MTVAIFTAPHTHNPHTHTLTQRVRKRENFKKKGMMAHTM